MKSDAPALLIVEDDDGFKNQLFWRFKDDYAAHMANNRAEAVALLRAHQPEVALLDLGLPPDPQGVSEGFATLDDIVKLAPRTKVIVLTGQDGTDNGARAIGAGAYDFLSKSVVDAQVDFVLDRAFAIRALERENERLRAHVAQRLPGVVGDSPAIAKVCRMIEKIAPANVSVILGGESGVGKEVMARALHELSPRRAANFVAINCAAIPGPLLESELFGYEKGAFTGAHKQTLGKIEIADGGTLFLDEIGDLPLELQVKLLRFLQERTLERIGGRREIAVDVRVVCATHRNLRALIEEGQFREDLYYRLSEIAVDIPPLRERSGDPVLIAQHLLQIYAEELSKPLRGFAGDALAAIDAYGWPGNVRELQNRLKRAVIMCEDKRVGAADLDLDLDDDPTPLNIKQVRETAERGALLRALSRSQGNISKAAKALGVSRPTLYDLMRNHNLRD